MNQRSFNSALLFGVSAGLRSMTAPALLALAEQEKGADRHWLLADPRTGRVLSTMAVGEMIFDKLPFAPNRIAPAGLSARLLSGAMCGAAVAREDETGGALVSSFAGFAIRKGARRVSGLPDLLVALVEDGLAVGIGLAAATMQSPEETLRFRKPSRRVA